MESRLSFTVSKKIKDQILVLAKKDDRSLSSLIRVILHDYLGKNSEIETETETKTKKIRRKK